MIQALVIAAGAVMLLAVVLMALSDFVADMLSGIGG